MAAILPFLEDAESNLGRCHRRSGFGAVSDTPEPESVIADLTRMHWMRQELARFLSEREFRIGMKDDGQVAIFLDRDIPKDAMPWSGAAQEEGHGKSVPYNLFMPSNTKMKCPIFDLPSGSPQIAGTCPGAMAGQWIVPEKDRKNAEKSMLPPPGMEGDKGSMRISVERSICSRCYAGKGNYISPYSQAGEMARYWWAKQCAESGEAGRQEFVDTMIRAVLNVVPRRPDRHGIKAVRIHSSGDFFSPAYFRLWMEAVRAIEKKDASVRFWFPTRVWGFKGYDWEQLDSVNNAVVRPSAYHMNDAAPEKLRPSNARGSTAIYHDDNLGMARVYEQILLKSGAAGRYAVSVYEANRKRHRREEDWAENWGPVMNGFGAPPSSDPSAWAIDSDPRYDWSCQTYAIGPSGKDASPSCIHALAPDGKIGCRACWISKNLRITYTAH